VSTDTENMMKDVNLTSLESSSNISNIIYTINNSL
jgi:hypothetical protein